MVATPFTSNSPSGYLVGGGQVRQEHSRQREQPEVALCLQGLGTERRQARCIASRRAICLQRCQRGKRGPHHTRMSGYGKELRFYSKGSGKPLYILRRG